MKIILTILMAFIAFPAMAAEDNVSEKPTEQISMDHSNHGNMKHDMASDSKAVMGKGVVHTIDAENNKINLTHEAIPALKWPEMTMDLAVAEDVDLSALKSEQDIHFHIELGEDKIYRITKIMMPQESPGSGVDQHNTHSGDHNHQH